MNIFWALIMGLAQGLTEFFPVSSSAHLTLMPWIFRFPDPGLAFDIALHAGALVAIVVALWQDWLKLGTGALKGEAKSLKLIGFLLLTSIPGAIIGVLLEDKAKTVFRTPLLVAVDLIVFGIILWAVDHYSNNEKTQSKMSWLDAGLIGLAQAVAIIPGVSRSGATITAGRALEFKRTDAMRYSFMAALPIVAGATVFGLRHAPLSEITSLPWIVGFLAAFGSSVWAMKFLLRYVEEKNFNIFVIWRFILAAIVVLLMIVRS